MTRSANVLLASGCSPARVSLWVWLGCEGVSGAAQPPNFTLSANPSPLGVPPWEAMAQAPSPGSTSGSSSCLWGYDWLASQSYPPNFQYLSPSSPSANAGGYVYQATSCSGGSCTSGSSKPSPWNQTPGGTTTDGTITWTNAGLQNCRGDVFVVKLQ